MTQQVNQKQIIKIKDIKQQNYQSIQNSYMQFKQQLLYAMCNYDPLAILQSEIFIKYERKIQDLITKQQNINTQINSNVNINNNKNKQLKNILYSKQQNSQNKHKYNKNNIFQQQQIQQKQTKITKYNISNIDIKIVQKRSHSLDNKINRNTNIQVLKQENKRLLNKCRRLEEQNYRDLAIWSNIMYNHFRINQNKEVYQMQYHRQNMNMNGNGNENMNGNYKNCKDFNVRQNKQNDMNNSNISNNTYINNFDKNKQSSQLNNTSLYNFSQILQTSSQQSKNILGFSLNQPNSIIPQIAQLILSNPSINNIKFILKQLFTQIQQNNQKTINQLNKLQKQNDRLNKNMQNYSMKQLQYIVKIKQIQKIIQQKDEQINKLINKIRQKQDQIRDKQIQFNRILRQKSREVEHLNQQNIRKNYLQELKQKLAIDSMRRITLCTLNKQKFQIQLKKQQLGLSLQHSNDCWQADGEGEVQFGTQETRCDQ